MVMMLLRGPALHLVLTRIFLTSLRLEDIVVFLRYMSGTCGGEGINLISTAYEFGLDSFLGVRGAILRVNLLTFI